MSFSAFIKRGMDVVQRLTRSPKNYDKAVEVTARGLAQDLAKEVKAGILEQAYGFRELSDKWVQTKKRKGYDLRKVLATHGYVESIGAYSIGAAAGVTAIMPLAKYLELGTKNMTALPHWQPALRKVLSTGKYKGQFVRMVFQ